MYPQIYTQRMGQFTNRFHVILVSRICYPNQRGSWLVKQRHRLDRQIDSFNRIERTEPDDETLALNFEVTKKFCVHSQVTNLCIDPVAPKNTLSTEIRIYEQVVACVGAKPLLFCLHAKGFQIGIIREELPRLKQTCLERFGRACHPGKHWPSLVQRSARLLKIEHLFHL